MIARCQFRTLTGHTGAARTAAVCLIGVAVSTTALFGQTAFDFAPPVFNEIGFEAFPHSVEAGDLNHDGFIDLVLAARNVDGLAIVFFGQSHGTFSPPTELDLGDRTNWVVVRDLNADGHLDLTFSHQLGLGRVSVLLGHGDGTFDAPVAYPVGREPNPILAEDFDADGDIDLAVINTAPASVSLLRNNGDGTFVPVQTVPIGLAASPTPSAFWADTGDLNGDGMPDVVVSSITHHFFSILLNTGDGTFQASKEVAGPGGLTLGVTASDFDGDGDLDLAAINNPDFVPSLVVLVNGGNATYDDIVQAPLAPGFPFQITSGDLDNDNRIDLAFTDFDEQAVSLLRNEGVGVPAFASPQQVIVVGGFPRVVLPVDLDGDGDLDLVAANISASNVAILQNQLPPDGIASPLRPRGGGVLAHPRLTAHGSNSTSKMREVIDTAAQRRAVADINADAHADATDLALSLADLTGTMRPGVRSAPPRSAGSRGGAAGGFKGCGDPAAGDCLEPNGTPGCENETCCIAVCEVNPICCSVLGWDQVCVKIAEALCEPPPCPGEEACFEPHDTVGCTDELCCNLICAVDAFCCNSHWDQICADQATLLCGTGPCMLPACPVGATVEPESVQCFDRINDGCNLDEPAFTTISCGETMCGTAWTLFIRDTDWYAITVDEPRELTWTVTSEFPSQVFIITGSCDTNYTVAATAFGGGCQPASASLAVEAGTYYLFVGPGTDVAPIHHGLGCLDDKGKLVEGGAYSSRYTATVTCAPIQPLCPTDLNLDGMVGIIDLLGLLSVWGTDPGGPPDFDGDGVVGILDLLTLLAAWGPCP